MGFWRRAFGLDLPEVIAEATSAPTFAVDELIGGADIDPAVFGLEAYATTTSPAPRIDRRAAIQVPAVKRSRDLIAGTLGGLPLDLFGPDKQQVANPFFDQPERNVPRSVTMTRTFEDMLFEGIAWWRITEFTWDNWPKFVKRVKPSRVAVNDDRDKVYIDGREVDQATLIRFDSPADPLLVAGARAIRTCLALDAYAANAAQGIPPLDFFTPDGDVDPFDDADDETVTDPYTSSDFLNDWATARRSRSTGWIPAAVKYNVAGFDPKALQMAEQRAAAKLEIANAAGIDPEDLGISTTSRTYANQFDRRKAFTDFTLGLYMIAFEGRISMGDVTPRGYQAKFKLDAFLRSDPLSRYQAYKAGRDAGALTDDEIRDLEDRPPLTAAQKAANKPPALPAPATPDAPASVTPLRSVQ